MKNAYRKALEQEFTTEEILASQLLKFALTLCDECDRLTEELLYALKNVKENVENATARIQSGNTSNQLLSVQKCQDAEEKHAQLSEAKRVLLRMVQSVTLSSERRDSFLKRVYALFRQE